MDIHYYFPGIYSIVNYASELFFLNYVIRKNNKLDQLESMEFYGISAYRLVFFNCLQILG